MGITVGNYEVRCTPIGTVVAGTRYGRFNGQWSVYVLPVDAESEPVAEGLTDTLTTSEDAEREGLREGSERAEALTAGEGGFVEQVGSYSIHVATTVTDGLCMSHWSISVRKYEGGSESLESGNLGPFQTEEDARNAAREAGRARASKLRAAGSVG